MPELVTYVKGINTNKFHVLKFLTVPLVRTLTSSGRKWV